MNKLDSQIKELSQHSGIPEEECRLLINGSGEEYTVAIIKKYLRTPEQKNWMNQNDISIEDMLNGRVEGEENDQVVDQVFDSWNKILGQKVFGY